MLKKIYHNIPEKGTVTFTMEKIANQNVRVALTRNFPNGENFEPLILTGNINEMQEELPDILDKYRRATNVRAQADAVISASEKNTKTSKKTSKKTEDDLNTDDAPLFAD